MQQYEINGNVLKTSIREAFHLAGKKLGWGFDDEGLGLNEEITFKALDQKLNLEVLLEQENIHYWLPWESLNRILSEKNTAYDLPKGVRVMVLPKSWFKVLE